MVLAAALLRCGLAFDAWHFNHRWRGAESADDAAWVRGWCRRHGIACTTGTAPSGLPRTEAAARTARWRFFQRTALRRGTACLWLAHHADDRAETLLLQLLRGAGPAGLAGPRTRRQIGALTVVRPLSSFRRAELARLARHWRIEWREDPSNLDPAHRRNLLRQRGLPALSRWAGRDVIPLLARTAEILEAEEDHWALQLPGDWPARLPLRSLRPQSTAWQRRALRAWLASQGIQDASFEQLEAVRGLILHPAPARINLNRNRFCRRSAGHLFLE